MISHSNMMIWNLIIWDLFLAYFKLWKMHGKKSLCNLLYEETKGIFIEIRCLLGLAQL